MLDRVMKYEFIIESDWVTDLGMTWMCKRDVSLSSCRRSKETNAGL
jgi:hypothetical protein